MRRAPVTNRHRAILGCVFVAFCTLICAGLVCAAAMVPAPPVVVPFVVGVGILFPMAMVSSLNRSMALLRDEAKALVQLRRNLDRLPEVDHPLGL